MCFVLVVVESFVHKKKYCSQKIYFVLVVEVVPLSCSLQILIEVPEYYMYV